MNTLDILIIAGVVVLLIAAWLHARKKGGSGCSGCSGCCSECSMKCNQKGKNK